MMEKKNRTLALLLSFAVIFFLLSSSAFIVIHADHDCIGEGCEICEILCICAERLQQLVITFVLIMLVAAASTFFCGCVADFVFSLTSHTLVSLKVKLSN